MIIKMKIQNDECTVIELIGLMNQLAISNKRQILWLLYTCYFSAGDGVSYPTRTIDLDSDGLLADRQRWMEEGEMDSNPGQWAKKDNSHTHFLAVVYWSYLSFSV